MTAQSAPYVRVYYAIIDDPKFEHIYTDDAALATWLRLLLNADALWPASAELPRRVRRGSLAKLVAAGLIDLLPADKYRIHGLDAERGERREAAAAAAHKRWSDRNAPASASAMRPHSGSNAGASGHEMPLRTEPNRTEPNQSAASAAGGDLMAMVRLVEELTDRPWTFSQGNRVIEGLRYDVRDFGVKRVEEEIRAAHAAGDVYDPNVLAMNAHGALNPYRNGQVAAKAAADDADAKRQQREDAANERKLQRLRDRAAQA